MQKEGANFATAKLKEYPSHLCSAFADAVQDWIDSESHNFVLEDAQSFALATQELVEPFRVDYTDLFEIGADTRGRASH